MIKIQSNNNKRIKLINYENITIDKKYQNLADSLTRTQSVKVDDKRNLKKDPVVIPFHTDMI